MSLLLRYAGVAELADARDLKSREAYPSYRFDPGRRQYKKEAFSGKASFLT